LTTDGNDGWIIPEFSWDPTHSYLIWTEIRFPNGIRVPLPLNAAQQITDAVQLLKNPPLGGLRPNTSNLLQPSLPLQYRTRILHFDL
jgi:hypothetical protein